MLINGDIVNSIEPLFKTLRATSFGSMNYHQKDNRSYAFGRFRINASRGTFISRPLNSLKSFTNIVLSYYWNDYIEVHLCLPVFIDTFGGDVPRCRDFCQGGKHVVEKSRQATADHFPFAKGQSSASVRGSDGTDSAVFSKGSIVQSLSESEER